jgi:hypothetical protein
VFFGIGGLASGRAPLRGRNAGLSRNAAAAVCMARCGSAVVGAAAAAKPATEDATKLDANRESSGDEDAG